MSSSGVPSVRVVSVEDDAEAENLNDYFCAFLGAIAVAFKESLASLELTVGQITEMVVVHNGQKDRKLLVALQAFDRLQQEFANLTAALEMVATARSIDGVASAN